MTSHHTPKQAVILTADTPDHPNYTVVYGYIQEDYEGDDDPGWLYKVKNGENATNELHATKSFCDFKNAHCVFTQHYVRHPNPPYWAEGRVRWFHGLTVPPIGSLSHYQWKSSDAHDPAALAQAVGIFNSKLSEWRAPVKGQVFLGELGESFTMIKRASNSLLRGLTDYHRSAKKYLRQLKLSKQELRKPIKGLSDLWLEYSFGWKPLTADIANAVDTVLGLKPVRKRITGYAEVQVVETFGPLRQILDTMYTIACNLRGQNRKKTMALCVAVFESELYSDILSGVAKKHSAGYYRESFGLTANEFVPAVYELIPYSFLVDYFTNLGDIVAAPWVDRHGLVYSYQVQKTTYVIDRRLTDIVAQKYGDYFSKLVSSSDGRFTYGGKRFDRVREVTVVPPFTVGYPDFGSLKWANMAALLLSKLRS